MSERFKCEFLFPNLAACQNLPDANNGVYKCENFAEHLAAGRFSTHYTDHAPQIYGLYITLKIREEYNQVYPYIASYKKPKLKIRAFFKIKAKLWSLCHKTNESIYLESSQGVSGPSMSIQDVLNEDNGYLENGELIVEYGFHVDAILGYDDIWIFNLDSKLFDCKKDNNTISINYRHGVYHSPKPLLVFHSPLLLLKPKKFVLLYEDGFCVEKCLQIANGVRLQTFLLTSEWLKIAEVGRMMKMMNVVHYCDSIIVRTNPTVLRNNELLERAIKLNMRQCALHMIGLWNFKDLMEELRKYSDEIPGEIMKVVVARFLKEEF